jgi:hypothetical protein
MRDELDRYYTPDAVADACVGVLDLRGVRFVLEPSVGHGAWVRAIRSRLPDAEVLTCDLDPEARHEGDRHEVADFLTVAPPDVDLIVGNPPFSEALAHVEHALTLAPAVGFLLRLAFLEGQNRAAFWRAHPAYEVHVLTQRPSFTGGGTDSAAYGFFVWLRGFRGPTHQHHLDWRGVR